MAATLRELRGRIRSAGSIKKITKAHVEAMKKAGVESVEIAEESSDGPAFSAADVIDPATGEVLLEANEELTARLVSEAQEKNVESIDVFFPERDEVGPPRGED